MAEETPRGPVIAIEGMSGSGKSRLVESVGDSEGWPVLREAWDRRRPRLSLGYRGPRDLLRLEGRLLSEELRRWRDARRLAGEGAPVLCDTGFLGPLSYLRGLRAVEPELGELRPPLLHRLRTAAGAGRFGLPDRTLYLDTPPALARRRAARSSRPHPVRFRTRHLAVGRVEREFWLGEASDLLRGRLTVLDGRGSVRRLGSTLTRLARRPVPPATPRELWRFLQALGQDP
jgi:hypothetical protein